MNEFFRKNGKWFLAILGVVLMVIWLMPSQNAAGGGGHVVPIGTLNGKKVTNADANFAERDLGILDMLAKASVRSNPRSPVYPFIMEFIGSLHRSKASTHLYLLIKEAQKYGIVATPAEVDSIIQAANLGEAQYRDIVQNVGEVGLRSAVSHLIMVRKLESFAFTAIPVSVPELEHIAADLRSSVEVAYLALSAKDPPRSVPEPDAAAIQKQFETYKEALPADFTGANPRASTAIITRLATSTPTGSKSSSSRSTANRSATRSGRLSRMSWRPKSTTTPTSPSSATNRPPSRPPSRPPLPSPALSPLAGPRPKAPPRLPAGPSTSLGRRSAPSSSKPRWTSAWPPSSRRSPIAC